uniref:Uncharacterized protein n=1 Tax=Solanum tuberosum TaxID=4113 RepID=M1DMR4_SOLTU
MVLRLNIDRIELAPQDWICKVQIVEMGRPRESPDKKCRFQNLILEDEETRFNSTVRVNPNYPQAVKLINWAKENKPMLLSPASEKTSTSSFVTPMIVTPTGQQVISVVEISSAPSMRVFYVEAEMTILDEFQQFCVLECHDANRRSAQRIERILNVQNAIGKQH